MRRRIEFLSPLIAATTLSASIGFAQDTTTVLPPPPAEYASPRATMFTFLRGVNAVSAGDASALDSALTAMDLAGASLAPPSTAARRAARDLWSSLNRIRQVNESELPGAADLTASDSTFVYFPRPFNAQDEAILSQVAVGDHTITFARAPDGRWVFSASTVRGISQLSGALDGLPRQVAVDEDALDEPAWVRDLVPLRFRTTAFLGLRPWQWVGLLVVIFVGVVVDFFVRVGVRPIVSRLAGRVQSRADQQLLKEMLRATGLFVAALVWLVLIRALFLPPTVDDVARTAAGVLAVLAGTLAGWKLTDLLGDVLLQRAQKTESKFDDIIVPLLRKTAKLFVLALGIVYGAQNLDINIVPLLTGLGIGGLAFAFAAKDTIENLFGSVAVVLDRPFEVGDWVVVGDVEGTVEELGFRSTRIRTFYNSQVTMPNSALVRAVVDNFGRRTYRRWKTYLGVQYDTTPDQLLAFTEGIRELVRQHPYTRKDYYQVWCNDFADSSYNILLYVFHEVPDWSTELRERERLFLDIVRLADRLGVQFAFPTRTLHLYQEDHQPPTTQHGLPEATTEHNALGHGVQAAREITAKQPWQRERPGPVEFEAGSSAPRERQRGGDG